MKKLQLLRSSLSPISILESSMRGPKKGGGAAKIEYDPSGDVINILKDKKDPVTI